MMHMQGECFTGHFESIGDMVTYLDQTPRVWRNHQASTTGDEGFTGTASYAQADKLIRQGWREGREGLDHARAFASRMITNLPVPAIMYDVAGAFPIVPAFVAGDPCHMVTHGLDYTRTRPAIRFFVSSWHSAGIEAQAIMARGAAILSWIDALESAGYPCEIVLHMGCHSHGARKLRLRATIMLKRAGQPLDVDSIAYPMIHASMLRRHGFALLERSNRKTENDVGGYYGVPADVPCDEPNSVQFGRMIYASDENHWQTPEGAVAHVQKTIAEACGDSVKFDNAA